MRALNLFRVSKPSCRTIVMGITQTDRIEYQKNISGVKARPERKAVNPTVILEPIF
jgi:hypothetical protein